MYLGMLIIGWTLGLALGLVATLVYGASLWVGFLLWSFGGAVFTVLGLAGLHVVSKAMAKDGGHAARVGSR
ncbi:hypothetical protein [Defluviimonas sp. WL0075]|uniref:Uncharacterized protein n=1 Tax=Albidovulum sediminicola TaxID=2984331 RepID=A0ABT2Z2V4_9RHOB|nr:hypothetical protein [Defluviimonas sp. WL0075]MCV2865442.1 hypothetical protein [Defluviimonas sp. WL0075]